jgi:hypothetical protein
MKALRVWLVLTLVFLAGFGGGVFTTRVITRRVVRAVIAHPELIQVRLERSLGRKLGLDARQKAEVHRVMQQSREQLKEMRRDNLPRLRTILTETRRQISAVLTPAQQREFEQYLADHPLPALSGTNQNDSQ